MRKTTNLILLLMMFWSLIFPSSQVEALVSQDTLGYKILAEPAAESHLVTVKEFKVYDGDTADFILDRKEEPSIKARFLLIDAPEMNQSVPYKFESRDRVIALLEQADLIQIEYEGKRKDRYQRDLVHVWVDGILLQEILVTEGYAIARYIHDYLPNSQYADAIFDSQDYAQLNAVKVWNDGNLAYLANAEYKEGEQPRPEIAAKLAKPSDESPESPVSEKRVVYIAPQAGEKYHYDPNCRGLRKANSTAQLTLSEALVQGYTLCGYED